jgi:hypothetical protein
MGLDEWSSVVPCVTLSTLDPQTICETSQTYGTLGVPDAANVPGGRYGIANWMDRSGNFWLFGGYSHDVTGTLGGGFSEGIVNDLWILNPSTNQWAWMGGDYATSNCLLIT